MKELDTLHPSYTIIKGRESYCGIAVEVAMGGGGLTDEVVVVLAGAERVEDGEGTTPDEVVIMLVVAIELEVEAFGGGAVLPPGLRKALAASCILVIWPLVKDVMHAS